jgi:hypothetical protein
MSVRFAMLFTIAGIAVSTASAESNSTWSARPPSLPTTAAAPTLAQSKTNPIKVQTYSKFVSFGDFSGSSQTLKILSVVDSVEIQSITLNRGNCTISTEGGLLYTYASQNWVFANGGGTIYNSHYDIDGKARAKSEEELKSEGWEQSREHVYRKSGVTLKYRETREFSTSCGEILEMVIKTNLGGFKFGTDS